MSTKDILKEIVDAALVLWRVEEFGFEINALHKRDLEIMTSKFKVIRDVALYQLHESGTRGMPLNTISGKSSTRVQQLVRRGERACRYLSSEDQRRLLEGGNKLSDIVDFGHLSIDRLGLTLRSRNCLIAEGIQTIGELMEQSEAVLRKTPNLGAGSMQDIKIALTKFNLSLRK